MHAGWCLWQCQLVVAGRQAVIRLVCMLAPLLPHPVFVGHTNGQGTLRNALPPPCVPALPHTALPVTSPPTSLMAPIHSSIHPSFLTPHAHALQISEILGCLAHHAPAINARHFVGQGQGQAAAQASGPGGGRGGGRGGAKGGGKAGGRGGAAGGARGADVGGGNEGWGAAPVPLAMKQAEQKETLDAFRQGARVRPAPPRPHAWVCGRAYRACACAVGEGGT